MSDAPLQFPSLRSLYKIAVVDDILNPQMRSFFMIRRSANIVDAIAMCRSSDGFKNFAKQFPKADIVYAEYVGLTEN